MRGRQAACCFTGHRPGKLPWRYNEEDLRCVSLKARIADAVEAAYQEGFRHFLCGMALGCDLYFCECVLRLRQMHPDVTVEAAVPCPSQADAWPPDQRRVRHAPGAGDRGPAHCAGARPIGRGTWMRRRPVPWFFLAIWAGAVARGALLWYVGEEGNLRLRNFHAWLLVCNRAA